MFIKKKYQMTKILASVFVIFFVLALTVGYVFAEDKAVVTEVEKRDGWRIIDINIDTRDGSSWCGSSRQLIVSGGGKGIGLLNIDSGNIRELISDPFYSYAFCSNDSRYIFFSSVRGGAQVKTLCCQLMEQQILLQSKIGF